MTQQIGTVVATCPKCAKPISIDHACYWCKECGEPLPENILLLLPVIPKEKAAPIPEIEGPS